jgi:hypothetical protein
MKELIRMMATCRKFRQVQVVRNFRTTQQLKHWVRNAYLLGEDEIVYAVRTQLRCIPRILNPSNSMGLGNKLITK